MKTLFLLILFLEIVACQTTSYQVSSKSSTIRSTEINNSGIIQNPVLVDLDIKESKVFGISTGIQSIETHRKMAVSDALKKSGSDIIIQPSFEIRTVDDSVFVTVQGFPGYYKNFRPLKKEDLPILEAGSNAASVIYKSSVQVVSIDTIEPEKPTHNNKSSKKGNKLNGSVIPSLIGLGSVIALIMYILG